MFNPFPSDSAKKYALEFINELESGKSICDFNGMFGILVCRKKNEDGTVNQTGGDIVLKAFSGQYKSKWNYEGFVPALVKQDEYDKAAFIIKRDNTHGRYLILTEYNKDNDYVLIICDEIPDEYFIVIDEKTSRPLVFSEFPELKKNRMMV